MLPPTLVPKQTADAQLPTWSGSPLKPENLGAMLMIGTKFCEIGDPRWLEARLVIDQGDIELIAPGQKVEIMLHQSADYVYVSQIEKVASKDLKVEPGASVEPARRRAADEDGRRRRAAADRPGVRSRRCRCRKTSTDVMRIGLVGRAKITTRPATLGSRL